MTKQILTLFLYFISVTTFGQKVIENKLTKEHQSVKGTKVSLIPPKGFADGVNFLGFQQPEKGSSIMVIGIPGPYSEVSAGISKENLLRQGVKASEIENLTINGLPATFVTGTQNAQGTMFARFVLMFGTENETIVINGAYPESLKKIGDEIKKSILTVFYEVDKIIDSFDALDYTIDVSETKLKFGKNISNNLVFSVDGKVPTDSNDKTGLIVGKSFSEIAIEDKKQFCIDRLKKTPIAVKSVEYTNEITIDGISGYEIYAKGKNKETGEADNVYQVILFSDTLYYILFGTTNDKTDKSIEEIKKAVKTFKRK